MTDDLHRQLERAALEREAAVAQAVVDTFERVIEAADGFDFDLGDYFDGEDFIEHMQENGKAKAEYDLAAATARLKAWQRADKDEPPPSDPNPYCWWHAESDESERWFGPHATRDEAVGHGRGMYGELGFVVIEARREAVANNLDSDGLAETVIEALIDCNETCWGEDSYGDAKALGKMLETTVDRWLIEYPWLGFNLADTRTRENIPPEDAT